MIELYDFVGLCWIVLIVCVIGLGIRALVLQPKLTKDILIIFVLVAVFLIAYSGIVSPWFYGIEYEDAFEYSYVGQVFALDEHARQYDLNPICVDGSLRECHTYGTLSHPIGLGVLASLGMRAFGMSATSISGLSVAFFGLAAVMVYVLLRRWGASIIGGASGCLLLVSTPSFVALGGTGFAEPTAASLVILVIVLADQFIHGDVSNKGISARHLGSVLILVGLISVLVLAILVKRECLALPVLLALGSLVSLSSASVSCKRMCRWRIAGIVCICFGSLLITLAIAGDSLLNIDAVRPGTAAPFAWRNLVSLLPSYISSLISLKYLALPMLALGSVVLIRKLPGLIVIITVVVGQLLLYLSFGQSYYTETYGEIPYYHFERYTLLLAPLLAVGAGATVDHLWKKARSHMAWKSLIWRTTIIGGLVVVITTGIGLGLRYREEYAVEEAAVRKYPVVETCRELPPGACVIAANPILFHIYCPQPVKVISLSELGDLVTRERLRELDRSGALFLFVELESIDILKKRYPNAAEVMDSVDAELAGEYDDALQRHALYRIRSVGEPPKVK